MKLMPKVLLLDIETLPNISYCFDLYSYKNPQMLIKEKSIITFAYKWLGDKQAKVIKGNPYDDKELCIQINSIIAEADYVVAHFGDKFDMRFIRSRSLINGIAPTPHVAQIDTYKLAKKYFHLNANKLDYLGKVLGLGRKMQTTWTLWEECAKGNKKAINKMAAYNKQDVVLLEQVFLKILPHTNGVLNYRLFGTEGCPHCGHYKVQRRGRTVTKACVRQRFQCQNKKCGHWFSTVKDEDES